MITIFNRKEVMNTFSMEQQSKIREILRNNDIDYKYKVINLNNANRGHGMSLGMNEDYSREYYIYVHKKDYDRAQFIISKARDS